jgi:hypothetical protein
MSRESDYKNNFKGLLALSLYWKFRICYGINHNIFLKEIEKYIEGKVFLL